VVIGGGGMLCRMFGAGGLGALIVEPIENLRSQLERFQIGCEQNVKYLNQPNGV